MHRGFLVTTKSFIQHRIESFSFILLYREKNLIQCLFNTIYRFKKSTKYHSIGIYAKKKRETNTQISLLFSPYFMFVRLSLSFSFCSFCGTQKKIERNKTIKKETKENHETFSRQLFSKRLIWCVKYTTWTNTSKLKGLNRNWNQRASNAAILILKWIFSFVVNVVCASCLGTTNIIQTHTTIWIWSIPKQNKAKKKILSIESDIFPHHWNALALDARTNDDKQQTASKCHRFFCWKNKTIFNVNHMIDMDNLKHFHFVHFVVDL